MRLTSAGELLVRDAIRTVLQSYGRAFDRRDWELLRSCYHADAYDDHGVYKGDIDGFVEHFTRVAQSWSATSHNIFEPLVQLHGDRAWCETRCIAHHVTDAADLVMGVRYLDVFTDRGGDWRIAQRRVVVDWMNELPASLATYKYSNAFAHGSAGEDDPSIGHLDRLDGPRDV